MLKQEVDRRNRYKTSLSIAFIDVDAFTPLCQKYGHEVSNFAADVFVVLLPETTPQNALVFSERVRSIIEKTRFETSAQQPTQLTVCVGVSGVEVTSGSITEKQFTVAASKALHTAKRDGPNKVCTYPEAIKLLSDSAGVNTQNGGERGQITLASLSMPRSSQAMFNIFATL